MVDSSTFEPNTKSNIKKFEIFFQKYKKCKKNNHEFQFFSQFMNHLGQPSVSKASWEILYTWDRYTSIYSNQSYSDRIAEQQFSTFNIKFFKQIFVLTFSHTNSEQNLLPIHLNRNSQFFSFTRQNTASLSSFTYNMLLFINCKVIFPGSIGLISVSVSNLM